MHIKLPELVDGIKYTEHTAEMWSVLQKHNKILSEEEFSTILED